MSTSAKAASGAFRDPILIVEDTVENQELLRALCRKLSIQCDIAENGAVALSMLAKKEYALFVVDLMMPVMDGRTFIGELKKKIPDAVVLVQTALDSSETIISIMKMGVFDYVIKPIDPELLRTVDRVILVGGEAEVAPVEGMRGTIETWATDEPSLRGIEGEERMRLVRDDIDARVRALLDELLPDAD